MSYEEKNFKGRINLGLCCINTELRKKNIFNSRTMIRKNFTVEKAKELALKNIKDLIPMIEYNKKNDINCFRWSSDMFPHFTDTETEKYTIDFALDELKKAGDLANKYGQRIVMHPGQYNQVGAKNNLVYEKTVDELVHHANILEAAGIDENGVLIIHGGGVYGDKETTKLRWIEQFCDLPKKVRNRLVIENCEKCYNVRDVLDIAQECKIPVVFDNHHYECYKLLHKNETIEDIDDIMEEVIETWNNRKMLCHISNQGEGRIGHHSDYIKEVPEYLIDIVVKHDTNFDLEVEAKKKEQAIFKLRKEFPQYF